MNLRNVVNVQMSDSLTPPLAQCLAQSPECFSVGRAEEGKEGRREEGKKGRKEGKCMSSRERSCHKPRLSKL